MNSNDEVGVRGGPMSDNVRGILSALVATGFFATGAALAKMAVVDYHVLQILFVRQVIVFLSSVPSVAKSFPKSLKTERPLIHACRLVGAFVAMACGVWALAVLPLTTAVTLGFAKVFFVALIAFFFLGERFGIHRVFAIVLGFIGVLVVMRPGVGGLIDIYALIPVVGALGAAVAVTSVRKLSQTESTATLLVYQAVFVGALAGVPLFWLWQTPDLVGWVLLISMGVLATFGNWIGVRALRLGEASVLGNIEYTKLVYAAVLGFLLFAEVPDFYTIVGAAIIVSSSIYIFRRETLRKNVG